MVIERHLLRAISRATSPQESTSLKERITTVFVKLAAQLDEGVSGPEAEEFLTRLLSRELSSVTSGDIIAELQQLVVEEGTSYKEYLRVVRSLVMCVSSVCGGDIPDSTIQLAVQSSVRDQFDGLVGSAVFRGKQDMKVPFSSVVEMMRV